MDDALRSGQDMHTLGVENISINPSYIGKATLMDKMFKERTYQPPWLWSVLRTTISIKKLVGESVRVICDPVAAGSERGPKNCGNCDADIKSRLKEFSASQQLDVIEDIACECKAIYNAHLVTESLYNGMGNFEIFR